MPLFFFCQCVVPGCLHILLHFLNCPAYHTHLVVFHLYALAYFTEVVQLTSSITCFAIYSALLGLVYCSALFVFDNLAFWYGFFLMFLYFSLIFFILLCMWCQILLCLLCFPVLQPLTFGIPSYCLYSD